MSLERIELILDALLDEAIDRYATTADMPPSLFAIGRRRVIVAMAADEIGRRVTLETATGLLSLMAYEVEAVYVGRIDSGFIQADEDMEVDPDTLEPGDIRARADVDPSISSVLLCEGYDSETQTAVLHVARLTLDEQGAPEWERLSVVGSESIVARALHVSFTASQFLTGRLPYRRVRRVAKNLHWSVSRRDSKIGRVKIPGEES